ncbi:RHS domain-containing protein, partial [Serratia marcescens]
TEQTTRFLWQGYRLLQEQRDDGSRRSWSYDPASPWSPLAALEQAGDSHSADIYWYHTDLNSAPLEVTDAAGNLCWSGQYDICFPDPKSRLSSFFIWNEGDGKFLSYSLPKGKMPSASSSDIFNLHDYFPASLGIPIFSKRAKAVFERKVSSEMLFYECAVENVTETMFLCKVNNYFSIIDEEASTFRELEDGSKLIDVPAYKCDREFFIARDSIYCERIIVSQQFVDLCNEEQLNIGFERC